MNSFLPVTLTEETLGQRHRELNYLVDEAFKSGVPFHNVENVLETTPVDRLFKIDLASKLKNVEYILRSLKDEDLLYVSRALKSKWLLNAEYKNIINPVYLENVLFPHMVTTAISKLKNWLYINIKDSQRCQEFYHYYAEKDIIYGIKFLSGCDTEFITNEVEKILNKLSPRQLKILCEKCPKVAETYFKNILINEKLKILFLNEEQKYFESLKVVLKLDPDIFFNISEKYFEKKFNNSLTKYILKHHKHIFYRKLELYTSRLLNMDTMAQCLSSEECKEIVIQLARAKYLRDWFSYKNVEPLVKRIPVDERAEFKKRIFVKKDIGNEVEGWPYELPTLPAKEYSTPYVFDDVEYDPSIYEDCDRKKYPKNIIRKKKRGPKCSERGNEKTYLDILYDEFRFMNFGRTLFELRKRLQVESSAQNREDILLLLVSKSGGRTENLATLLELLSQHSNEPLHIRAGIVRSLVKRAAVWRLPEKTWDAFLKFGQGLGLDGSKSDEEECDCHEGLHAVVLRNLLEIGTCEPILWERFIQQFSWFDEYSINVKEKKILKVRLPLMIQRAVEAVIDTEKQIELLELLLNTLKHYRVSIDTSPLIPATRALPLLLQRALEAETKTEKQAELLELLLNTLKQYRTTIDTSALISATRALAEYDYSTAQNIFSCLFSAKIARRTLFYENFKFIQTDASYLNALRHDPKVLDINKILDLIGEEILCPIYFLRKISIYFSENGGMMETYLAQMKKRALTLTESNATLAKSLCLLLGADIVYISGFNHKEKHLSRFAADLRANMHAGRKKIDFNNLDLKVIGAKAVANKVVVCPDKEVEYYVEMLLKWKRTVKLGVVLSQRIGKEADTFAIATPIRPTAILKTAIKYFRRRDDPLDMRVWDIVKPVLQNIDMTTKKCRYLCDFINKRNYLPSTTELQSYILLYKYYLNDSYYKALTLLCRIELQFPNVCEEFMENVLTDFLNEMTSDKYQIMHTKCILLYIRILVKYLLFTKTEDVQRQRISVFAVRLFNNLECIRGKGDIEFIVIFHDILKTLKNNKVLFDNTMISPLPVIESFLSWMQKFMPIESNFTDYVYVHLTMLYCKVVRKCLVQTPHVFSDEDLKFTERVDVVGKTFGKYIASEVKHLMSNYFDSITELYRDPVCEYFRLFFHCCATKYRFIAAVIQGILDNSVGIEATISVYLLKHNFNQMGDKLSSEIVNRMKEIKNTDFKCIFFAVIY